MKKISAILALLIILTGYAQSQFKDMPYETKKKINNSKILGFINPDNFSLKHSLNVSYQTYGNNTIAMTSYTGTLAYKIMKNMNVSADVTMQYSPYASLANGSNLINQEFQNSLSGVYLSRVSFDYMPTKDLYINFQYRNLKNNMYWYDDTNPYYYSRY